MNEKERETVERGDVYPIQLHGKRGGVKPKRVP